MAYCKIYKGNKKGQWNNEKYSNQLNSMYLTAFQSTFPTSITPKFYVLQHTIGGKTSGFQDCGFKEARFFNPQGVAWRGDDIYVADTDNHRIRLVRASHFYMIHFLPMYTSPVFIVTLVLTPVVNKIHSILFHSILLSMRLKLSQYPRPFNLCLSCLVKFFLLSLFFQFLGFYQEIHFSSRLIWRRKQ